ncbi:TonB-dependent receptor [Polluticoccus soli]|uniref:TonB-dependent receptor n=1 Tax=Polluticoccus soli TaxID=3034150 RepID=UPI0023E2B4D6|nr:TonB-dependent receptor [Flavipsychrobacter sp. JY13-12]
MLRQTLVFFLVVLSSLAASAQNGYLVGTVKDEKGRPMEIVTIAVKGSAIGTVSNVQGEYSLSVPTVNITVVYSLVGYKKQEETLQLKEGEVKRLDIVLKKEATTLEGVTVTDTKDPGVIKLDVKKTALLPGDPFSGIESLIKTFVGTNNELTSQYNVRGGNYDENLVYVNDFEIYRPFLTRSGQQEGMSFINADLVSGVNFSVGGFQAKYGDKMSSVLDVDYKRPKKFGGRILASMLGVSASLEGISKNEKLTYLIGVRQKSNQYLLKSQPTKGVYNPSFTDLQALINYKFSPKWESEILANYARNRFQFFPEEATSSFGLINRALQLRVIYEGGEIDQFDSRFGGWSTTYHASEKLKLKLLASGFQTNERETYDIFGEYLLGELETDLGKEDFGQVKYAIGTGVIHTYARNYLKVNVGNLAHRGSYAGNLHFVQWGLDANITDITDKLHEWERRDSARFTQPYMEDKLELTRVYNSASTFNYMRYAGFIQDNFRFNDSLGLTVSLGVRFNYSTLNNEFLISPRAQVSYKPKWEKDIIFKLAGGLYQQPPFYREMRDLDGNVNKNLKAQKSFHTVLGTEYNFKTANRPFKFTTEIYYKGLWDIVPYEYDNVRIRYFGQNNAVGYAYGGELRLYGDIVKDATSWVSVGVLKTAEDVTNDYIVKTTTTESEPPAPSITTIDTIKPGYIPRPTDQRFMVGMYFEDYFPKWKNYKMHLNLMYATGLPFGPPDKARYGDTLRLPDYKRVDIGFSALLLNGAKHPNKKALRSFENIWLSAEVFNLLGIQNTLSYSWIQDMTTNQTYAVPNRLTSRLINVKLVVDF